MPGRYSKASTISFGGLMKRALKLDMTLATTLAMLGTLGTLQACAQTPPAPTTPPAGDELSLAVATEWAQAAIATCKTTGYNVTATVMNSDYSIKLVLRADGTPAGTVDVGRRKAYTVLKMGMSSGDFGASVGFPAGTPLPAVEPGQPRGVPPGNADQNLIIAAGGLPIKMAGKVVAAISISGAPGGDKDVVCAEAGLAKIAGKLK